MTPRLNRDRGSSESQLNLHLVGDSRLDSHLTSDQMSDLLDRALPRRGETLNLEPSATARAEAHLRSCAICAAEFASLREALLLFQEASVALADREFSRLRKPAFSVLPAHRPYSQTLFWVAASAILMAGLLPLEMRWQRTASAPAAKAATAAASARTSESDEALLEDIDRELSASVPAPMQALADPTDDASSQASIGIDDQTSSQRKD